MGNADLYLRDFQAARLKYNYQIYRHTISHFVLYVWLIPYEPQNKFRGHTYKNCDTAQWRVCH